METLVEYLLVAALGFWACGISGSLIGVAVYTLLVFWRTLTNHV